MVFNSKNCPRESENWIQHLSQFDNMLIHRAMHKILSMEIQEMWNGSKNHIKPLINNLYNS
jgi:hypothetical protein